MKTPRTILISPPSLIGYTEAIPLGTASHVTRLLNEYEGRTAYDDWTFQPLENVMTVADEDHLFKHFVWGPPLRDLPYQPEITKQSIVVAVQPPWILGDLDMTDISSLKAVSIPLYLCSLDVKL